MAVRRIGLEGFGRLPQLRPDQSQALSGFGLRVHFGFDRFPAPLVAEIAQADQCFTDAGSESHQLLIVGGVDRVRLADTEFETGGPEVGANRRFAHWKTSGCTDIKRLPISPLNK